tara:strand:+ start:12225 stop:13454 length:1230 start_codon:yes stop_codon:yes gene_type:complete
MALTQAILKVTIAEDKYASVPQYVVTDLTDYTGNSVTVTDVKSAIKIEVNGTEYYNNLANIATTPDINGASAGQTSGDLTRVRTKTTSDPILLPTNSNGSFTQGTIKITYTITDGSTTVSNVISIDNTLVLPIAVVDTTLSLVPTSPSITAIDETVYIVNSITPTITRDLTCYYPSSSGEAATSTSSTELITERFYTGQQTIVLISACVWDYTSRTVTGATNDWTADFFTYNINNTITKTVYVNVPTDTGVCDIFCCVSEYNDKVVAATGDYKRMLQARQGQIAYYLSLISTAFSCSSTADVSTWVDSIKTLCDCRGDCSCNDGSPILIIPVSSAGSVAGACANFTTTAGQTTIQNNLVVGKVYSTTQNDFIVYLDNIPDAISFVSSTGVITFSAAQPAGVAGKILLLK